MWKQKSIASFFSKDHEQDTQFKRSAGPPVSRPAKVQKLSPTSNTLLEKAELESRRNLEGESTPAGCIPHEQGICISWKTHERLVTPGEGERFASRAAGKFPFLQPDQIRDAAGNRPAEFEYDPGTLHVPVSWFKTAKISEGQRQWWQFKASNFDSILLFKMGKFYEMFEMDAHTGVEVLGLIYMKGDQPHCGFPESKYHCYAGQLARAGHRVVVIEQTETPDQLRIRNEQRKAAGLPKVGIVSREVVAILTQGTLTDPEMLDTQRDASYLWCMTEAESNDGKWLGACAVDCSTGEMLIGSWKDDELRTTLQAHLAALRPVEVVIPKDGMSSLSLKVLTTNLQAAKTNIVPSAKYFWTAQETIRFLKTENYYQGVGNKLEHTCAMYKLIEEFCEEGRKGETAISAFAGALAFLRSALLDKSVVSLGKIRLLTDFSSSGVSNADDKEGEYHQYVALDGAALQNLEVFETIDGNNLGTLLSTLDACSTAAGRRTLKKWLCCPLRRAQDILARQDAIQTLMTEASYLAASARTSFAGIGDLERSIARICASSFGGIRREAPSVVMYEDSSRRKVEAFVAALRGLQRLQQVMITFNEWDKAAQSSLLSELTTPGKRLPNISDPLGSLLQAADWDLAAEQGRVIPKQGFDEQYDLATSALRRATEKLEQYLQEVREILESRNGVYFTSFLKESHVLEVAEELTQKVPTEFELLSQKKGVKRFMTPKLRHILHEHASAVQRKEEALSSILQGFTFQFAEQQAVWDAAVSAMGELDALMSLALAANQAAAGGPICRPLILSDMDIHQQIFKAVDLRHPSAARHTSHFVPNDINLGDPTFMMLTGPNMGGKSTLIRQVCLAILLAQIGAFVPATSLELTPVDAIFVRMGARDAIMSSHSTFFVELTETAAALNRATNRSMVALDELGRGTSTIDGFAIASAVVQYLVERVKCRAIFATHYHKLANAKVHPSRVSICHMACCIYPEEGSAAKVTFLYKLAQGVCPKSYGTHVASLAGIQSAIVCKASAMATKLDTLSSNRGGLAQEALNTLELDAVHRLVQLLRSRKGTDPFQFERLKAVGAAGLSSSRNNSFVGLKIDDVTRF